ncbi:MAG: sulfatase-like hydrolase/transferase [Desulfobacterales bacterium]|nr:sulfatase-like hydrolase/transferase [Desulfobacterales bacterium]
MKIGKCFITFAIALVIGCIRLQCDAFASENRVERRQTLPNFITLVIDDMGYSDISAFGGEVPTPNLDGLAENGIKLTNFYAGATSSPSRSMLFTGKDNNEVGLGEMKPTAALSLDVPIFPELLHDAGYYTMMTGKWHMGEEPEYYPYNRGFEQTRGLLLAGGDTQYLSDENGKNITAWFPDKAAGHGRETFYNENGVELRAFPPNAYSTDYYTDMAIEMLEDWDGERPFYLNVSHIATHSPWQAPQEITAKYIDTYTRGWDVLYQERFDRMKQLGLIPVGAELPAPPADHVSWDSLTSDEQRFEAKRMAVYAAMIEVLDDTVGRLVQYLKDIGQYENTVFFIYSDNGADRHATRLTMPEGNPIRDFIVNNFITEFHEDQELLYDKMGDADTFIGNRHEWAWLSNTPLNNYKESSFEGGIRTLSFIHYPGSQADGVISDIISVMDIPATILEMASIDYPDTYNGKSLEPMRGVSFTGLFDGTYQGDPERNLGFRVDIGGGYIAGGIRIGNWKLSQDAGEDVFYLYNLAEDPFEQDDLSESDVEKYDEMMAAYNAYMKSWTGVTSPGIASVTVTSSDFTIGFSQPVDQLTINEDTITVKVILPGIGYGTVAGNIKLDETATTAIFIPYNDFVTGLSYSVIIEGATDAEGNPLEPGEWSFTGGDETDLGML